MNNKVRNIIHNSNSNQTQFEDFINENLAGFNNNGVDAEINAKIDSMINKKKRCNQIVQK